VRSAAPSVPFWKLTGTSASRRAATGRRRRGGPASGKSLRLAGALEEDGAASRVRTACRAYRCALCHVLSTTETGPPRASAPRVTAALGRGWPEPARSDPQPPPPLPIRSSRVFLLDRPAQKPRQSETGRLRRMMTFGRWDGEGRTRIPLATPRRIVTLRCDRLAHPAGPTRCILWPARDGDDWGRSRDG
jgi:hypothetical protein